MSLNTNYLTPTGREEAWRFSPVKELTELIGTSGKLNSLSSFRLADTYNGVTLKESEIHALSSSTDEAVIKLRQEVTNGQILEVSRNLDLEDPIVVERQKFSPEATGSRLQIIVGENSHVKIILKNLGAVILSEEIEISLNQGSSLHFVSIQNWESGSKYLARQHAILAKDSTFKSVLVTTGGKINRILPTVEYTGPGSFADLSGLYFAGAGQHLEHRLHVDHNIANAKSRVKYKGALSAPSARTVWIGDVYIRANAEGTDTYELNRNLLLTDGARADSVPNLEIETGEIVGAGHASTSGRFDDEQLFYLMSRGIPESMARRLVIRGFFAEILNEIRDEQIEEELMSSIDSELEKVATK